MASVNITARQRQRTDTAANWTARNPVLLAGEIGFESNTGKFKIGNGSSAWSALAYQGVGVQKVNGIAPDGNGNVAISAGTLKVLPLAGGTMAGVLYAQSNTAYTTRQVRNIVLAANTSPALQNGDVLHVYE